MSSLLKFFIEIGKLKQAKRSGWLAYGIKNPETTADHLFRAAILAWALNKKRGLNEGKIIKTILVHHLYETHMGDITPYGYLLPQSVASKREKTILKEILKNPPPFSLIEEQKRVAKRHREEERIVKKLISRLPDELKKEIDGLWQDYLDRKTKTGKFAWQASKAETFLQALEYWKKEGKIHHKLWNRWVKKALKDPVILQFKRALDRAFLQPNKKRKKRDVMDDILDFLIEVGKLKRLRRRGWVLRGIKEAETVAQHTLQMIIMSWLLGEMKGLDTNRIVKIALVHDLCEVYAGDQTPYDSVLASNKLDKKAIRKMVGKPARLPYPVRLEWLLKKRAKEWKAMVKLTSHLPKALQDEIINLWIACEEGLTKEGRFASQVDKLVNLFQAVEYWKKDKEFPIIPWWIEIKEKIDDPLLLKFIGELDKEFAIAKYARRAGAVPKKRSLKSHIK